VIACELATLDPLNLTALLQAQFAKSDIDTHPAMSLYAIGKNDLVAHTRIGCIRWGWTSAVKVARLLAIIGVSPNEQDDHVWEVVATTPAERIVYVGGGWTMLINGESPTAGLSP